MASKLLHWLPLSFAAGCLGAGDFSISHQGKSGELHFTNTFANGIVAIESATTLDGGGNWTPVRSYFSGNIWLAGQVTPLEGMTFYRARQVSLDGGWDGFTNLVKSYGVLTTVAGAGGTGTDGVNKWLPSFEGQAATNALLSRPHTALGDAAGNIYIADKVGHGIRKVRPDGTIITVAGINVSGNGPDYLTNATSVALSNPNGIWVQADGTVYILDMDNAKVRKLDTNGMLRTLFTVPNGGPSSGGRGLWVSADEAQAFVCCSGIIYRWTPASGVATNFAGGFTADLGNIIMDYQGKLLVSDRGGHRVYRVGSDGIPVLVAGNGDFNSPISSGVAATNCQLYQVRGVWPLPTGGFLLATDNGSQIGYVDAGGTIYRLVNGTRNGDHAGDGDWFYDLPDMSKVSKVRAVTMDYFGNILITEHDSGYVRMIRFLPMR
jgi:hypothetical protein